jgi:hypothetical protein
MSTNENESGVSQPVFRAATPPQKVEQHTASRPDEAAMRRMRSPFSVDAATGADAEDGAAKEAKTAKA